MSVLFPNGKLKPNMSIATWLDSVFKLMSPCSIKLIIIKSNPINSPHQELNILLVLYARRTRLKMRFKIPSWPHPSSKDHR